MNRYSLRQGAHCPGENGFAPTETECRLAEVRSRSMSCNYMTRISQQECRGILEIIKGKLKKMAAKNEKRQFIKIRGANEHNLKNIDLDIPRNELVVLTGLSGSGKSSLAFDTIYAEGQRRYMESLSSYARQFLGQMEKPDVESIEGLSPAISIDQKSTNRNPRSTVGTVTEIYDYFRLLYARIGIPHCPKCGRVRALVTLYSRVKGMPQKMVRM